MRELSLFTGAGGGVLGTHLLGWRHCGYVEWDEYCQKVIAQRIKDGILDEAPIFGDVRAFIREGYAASYTGMVDVVTAGFPCQPFSVAGKRKGVDDERNMWPATADVIRIVRPRFVLLENVPGIRDYLPVVIRDLRRLGYAVRRPLQLGADDVGAPHRRKRIWIVAWDTESNTGHQVGAVWQGTDTITGRICETVANTESGEPGQPSEREGWENSFGGNKKVCDMADTRSERRMESASSRWQAGIRTGEQGKDVANTKELSERARFRPPEQTGIGIGRFGDGSCTTCRSPGYCKLPDSIGTGLEIRQGESGNNGAEQPTAIGGNWWSTEPDVGRVAHGVASRVDRLKAIGNGQVPAVVRAAWEILIGQV